jgi:aminomethyltransferase
MAKKTPLYAQHVKLNGQIVEFAGYLLPVQYEKGIIFEHTAVRTRAGLFDVSHMGELEISGDNAEQALNYLLSNDIRGMYDGQVRYSLIPNENGGAVDDVLIYRYNQNRFLVVVNASNADKDAKWIESHLPSDVGFKNISDDVSQIALQGPLSQQILATICDEALLSKKNYSFVPQIDVAGVKCLVSRTGYTGEDGFELYCQNSDAETLYQSLLAAGEPFGITPCGLGARDTLRLEAAMPLYGHELSEEIPINETGLDFAIKYQKEAFIGKSALISRNKEYSRIGVKVADRGIAREHCEVYSDDQIVGVVTSGTFSPTLNAAIAMLRVKTEYADKPLYADVRGRRLKLERVPLPFYMKKQV